MRVSSAFLLTSAFVHVNAWGGDDAFFGAGEAPAPELGASPTGALVHSTLVHNGALVHSTLVHNGPVVHYPRGGLNEECWPLGNPENEAECHPGLECRMHYGLMTCLNPHQGGENESCRLLGNPQNLPMCDHGLQCVRTGGQHLCERPQSPKGGLHEQCRLLGNPQELPMCDGNLVCFQHTCEHPTGGEGQQCNLDFPECNSNNLYCDYRTNKCEPLSGGLHEPCRLLGNPDNLPMCNRGLDCERHGSSHVCELPKGQVGEGCRANGDCESDLVCRSMNHATKRCWHAL